MKETKPTLFKLLICYFMLACFVVTILSILPYIMMKNVFSNQIVKSEKKATAEANEKLSFLLEDLEGLADRVYINTAVQDQLNQKIEGNLTGDSLEVKDVFSNNRALYKINQYDAYILGFNGYSYRYSYTGSYETDLDLNLIQESQWYQDIIKENGRCMLVNGQSTGLPGMEDKIIFGRRLNNTSGNNPVGIFLIVFQKEVVDDVYSTLTQDDYVTLYIIDETGSQITTLSEELMLNPEVIEQAERESALFLEQGAKQVVLTDIKNTDWTVVEILNLDFLMSTLEALRIVIIGLAVFMVIIAAAISYLLLNKLYRPIDQLRHAMAKVEQGDFEIDFLETEKKNEISRLNQSLLDMVKALETSFDNLYREQRERREAEIKMLQAQIKPHFLYNTLTSVRILIRTDKKEEADQMIIFLIKLLKNTFDNKEMVSIGEELSILECYSGILKYRYQNFHLEFNVDEAILNCMIPKLLLQPLVENSIVHNLDVPEKFLMIKVVGKREKDRLILNVIDNGKGIDKETENRMVNENGRIQWKSDSIGMQNVQDRIIHCFGEEYGLCIEYNEKSGAKIRVEIPVLFS